MAEQSVIISQEGQVLLVGKHSEIPRLGDCGGRD